MLRRLVVFFQMQLSAFQSSSEFSLIFFKDPNHSRYIENIYQALINSLEIPNILKNSNIPLYHLKGTLIPHSP